MMGGDFTPWTEFYWGGNDGGGLEPAGGGIFGQASGTRGSPPSTENPGVPGTHTGATDLDYEGNVYTEKRVMQETPSPGTRHGKN